MNEDLFNAIKEFHKWSFSFAPTAITATAAQLDLFSQLETPVTPEVLAQKKGLSPRGVSRLLRALARLGVLEEKRGTYRIKPSMTPLFSSSSPFYIGHYFIHAWKLQERWQSLPQVVTTGTPLPRRDDPDFPVTLARGLFAIHWFQALELGKRLSFPPGTVLDVAGGSGVWSAGILLEHPELKGTVLDLPQVVERGAKPILQGIGLSERYSFIPGDMFQVEWGQGYTAVILGHICHALGRDQILELMERARSALEPGGRLVVIDFLTDPQDLFPAIFSINMLVATDRGDVYSMEEYGQWLETVGFHLTEAIPMSGPWKSAALVATPA